MTGLGVRRLDWGELREDGKGNGGLGLGGLSPRSIAIDKAGLKTGVWGQRPEIIQEIWVQIPGFEPVWGTVGVVSK